MSKPELFVTEDGSHSLISSVFGETYHSRYGALEESQVVFIDAGLHEKARQLEHIKILEIGFGTGLNALLTLKYFQSNNSITAISYDGIEAYPIDTETTKKLNYTKLIDAPSLKDDFLRLHEHNSVQLEYDGRFFDFRQIHSTFEEYAYEKDHYDLVYYDAFAPNAQPTLWNSAMLAKMHYTTAPGGVLTTYCAKGSFKRTLKALGFTIESLPGPGKKREITRAIKQ